MLLCCTLLAAFALPGRAEQTTTSTELLVRLKVYPMAEPKPALRYLLLPDLNELAPGNPIPNYLRCFMDQDFSAAQEKLGKAALRQADRAARMDKPDWQILQKAKTDGIGLLLPDVQKMRMLAAELKDRFQEEQGQRRFDDGIYTAKTMFSMSRHFNDHPTLIGQLVGIAIAYVTIGPLEDMLEQPGCPNLYWALTSLPNPFITIEKGIEGERIMIGAEIHRSGLDDKAPMSAEQIKKTIAFLDRLQILLDNKETKVRAWLDKRVKDEKLLDAARRRLVECGMSEELVRRFPADQVILVDQVREYEVLRDDMMKYMNLPTWQVEKSNLPTDLPAARKKTDLLFNGLLPAIMKVRRAQSRLEQRIALLRHVEAFRLYAAAHDGKLPEKLSDCSVPLPDDPITGKPFRYKLEGSSAHLRGTPPRGEEKNPFLNVHYEITIQK
jgi:hypothetical protein